MYAVKVVYTDYDEPTESYTAQETYESFEPALGRYKKAIKDLEASFGNRYRGVDHGTRYELEIPNAYYELFVTSLESAQTPTKEESERTFWQVLRDIRSTQDADEARRRLNARRKELSDDHYKILEQYLDERG